MLLGKLMPVIWTLPDLMICCNFGVEGLSFMVAILFLVIVPTPPVLTNSRSVPVSSALHLASLSLWYKPLYMCPSNETSWIKQMSKDLQRIEAMYLESKLMFQDMILNVSLAGPGWGWRPDLSNWRSKLSKVKLQHKKDLAEIAQVAIDTKKRWRQMCTCDVLCIM